MHAKNNSEKGIVFSLEAAIALLALGVILILMPSARPIQMEELLILQEENDLLRIWSYSYENDQGMSSDVRNAFGDRAELWIKDNRVLRATTNLKNTISSEGVVLDELLNEKKVRIVVYHN